MNTSAVRIVKALLKKGFIARSENPALWGELEDPAVMSELEDYKQELDFDLYRSGSRLYLIPLQENELFLQNNVDFRRDIKAQNDVRNFDLYLLNYLAVYLLSLFFGGEGADPLTRDFITRQDFLKAFTRHCSKTDPAKAEQAAQQYSLNFVRLGEQWQSKLDGDADTKQLDTKLGCLNRILSKLSVENLFTLQGEQIRPTQKCKDLMPYFLRKERVAAIHAYLNGGHDHAADQ